MILVLLLALFVAPVINAQTAGQMDAEYQFALCGADCEYGPYQNPEVSPRGLFTAASFGITVNKYEVRVLAPMSGTGTVYVRRQANSGSYFFEPGLSRILDADVFPEGTEVVYTALRVNLDGTRSVQHARTFVSMVPQGASLGYVVSGIQAVPEMPECDLSRHCTWKPTNRSAATRFTVEATGFFPRDVYVFPLASDGTAGSPVKADVSEDGTTFTVSVPRFSNNQTTVKLVVWYSGTRTVETVDGWLNGFVRPPGNPPRDGRPQ